MMMAEESYEKLSIRESARSLKKYGSTSKYVPKNENYIRHNVSDTDTLQGIALKYNVTIEQIRRINKLWASDSLFLREYLLIPHPEGKEVHSGVVNHQKQPKSTSCPESAVQTPTSSYYDDEDNIADFLDKIDAAIASTKEEVKRTTSSSEFLSSTGSFNTETRKKATSRMKQLVNNNSNTDLHTVVVQQGKKVKTSIANHERQQDELFEL